MKRRTLFKMLAGIAAAPAVVKALPKPAENSHLPKGFKAKLDSQSWEDLYLNHPLQPVPPPTLTFAFFAVFAPK